MENERQKEIRYYSMFTGVGGFELGFTKSNILQQSQQEEQGRQGRNFSSPEERKCGKHFERTKWKSEPVFTCVGFSEIDKYASELLKNKFPTIKNWGDCTKINPSELPNFDMLCGGFPCQAFSIAGKRRGFQDTRGTLFFEIARILEVKRPKFLLLENVKGILNHEKGKTFSIIIQTLEELGYRTQWMVLNSKFFGVPQNRERVFIIGSLRGESRPEILPLGETEYKINDQHKETRQIIQVDDVARENKHKLGDRLKEDGATFTLNSIEQRGILEGGGWEKRHENIRRVYGTEGISPTIPTGQGGGVMTKIIHPKLSTELAYSTGRDFFRNSGQKIFQATNQIRRLTPIECERLQGFPDGWTEGFSDTQRYKMMGNAVTVNVIKAIGERLFA